MKNNKANNSQEEVQATKEALYDKVKHMLRHEQVAYLLKTASAATEEIKKMQKKTKTGSK